MHITKSLLSRNSRFWFSHALALAIMALGVCSIASLLWHTPKLGNSTLLWNDIAALMRFSLWQATLSTVWSLTLGLATTLAVYYYLRFSVFRHYFMPLWIGLNSLLIVLPTTIVAQGLLLVWGRGGVFAPLRQVVDADLFGLNGIIMAHMLLNIPLAFRVLFMRLQCLPAEYKQTLTLSRTHIWWRFWLVYLPHLLPSLRQAGTMIFLVCFTSFSLVLIFGGGPAANTLEVAIYTAVRFELDFTRAAFLSLIQWGVCAVFLWFSHDHLWQYAPPTNSKETTIPRHNRRTTPLAMGISFLVLLLMLMFLFPPLLLVVIRGLNIHFWGWLEQAIFWQSMGYSISIAIGSSLLSVMLALILSYASLHVGAGMQRTYRAACNLFLMVPTVTFATGIFLLLRPWLVVGHGGIAPSVLLIGNALFCLPFAYRILLPTLQLQQQRYAMTYALNSGCRPGHWWYGHMVGLRREIRLCFALCSTLSLGEMGLIALLQNQSFTTLPWLIYQSISRFQIAQASALSLWLLILILTLFALSEMSRKSDAEH